MTKENRTNNGTNFDQIDGIIQNKMNRNIISIHDLRREYVSGLSGIPALKTLEEEHTSKWRRIISESKFFTSRCVIYREVEKIARERSISCEEAAHVLEIRRTELGASIDKMIKIIKASNV